jgi:hypothetical protein
MQGGTYMMHIQSNMYDATSFMDGTPMPRTVLMVQTSGSVVVRVKGARVHEGAE